MTTSTVVFYGKDYNAEMAAIVDRRTAPKIWTFREFGQSWVAYRKDADTIVVLQDDSRLDFTRAIVMTRAEFDKYQAWRVSPNSVYADR